MKIKKEEIFKVYNIIKECTYSKSTSALALIYIKLKEEVDKLENQRLNLAQHLGKENTQEYMETLQKIFMREKVTTTEEFMEFSKNYSEAVNSLLEEEIELELPEIDLDLLLNENKLKAKDAAIIYNIFK